MMTDRFLTEAQVARALRATLADPAPPLPPGEAIGWIVARSLTIMQVASALGLDRVADEALGCAEIVTNSTRRTS